MTWKWSDIIRARLYSWCPLKLKPLLTQMRIDINAEYNFWKRWLARVQMKKRPPKFSPKTSIHQWLADHLFQKTQSIQCFNKKVCVPTKWLTRDLNLSYLTLHFLPKRLTSSVTLDQSVTCGPQSSHPKRVSYILDLRCVRDCPLFSGEVYISNCPTVFFSLAYISGRARPICVHL